MSNFKFNLKRGILSNTNKFLQATVATAAVSASNGLALAQTLNKTVTDGLAIVNVFEEMAMHNASNYISEQIGEEVTLSDIRNGDVTGLIEEANASERAYSAQKGKYRLEKRQMKLNRKIDKLNKKLAVLKEQK